VTPAIMRAVARRLHEEYDSCLELRQEVGRAAAERLWRGRDWTPSTYLEFLRADLATRDEARELDRWALRAAPRLEDNRRILCISDLHAPWVHPDTLAFLRAVAAKYKPTRVVLLGDEVDAHAMSFHDHDPDLHSPGDELELAIDALAPLYKLFPKADVCESNHGSLAYRRAKANGISRKYIRDYEDVLKAPVGWRWHPELRVELPGGEEVLFHHGISANVANVVRQRGMCVVQGHYHTSFGIAYTGNPNHLLWGLQVGCSIDPPALAFEYDKLQVGRPILGHGIILDGLPHLLPMVLKRGGRWNQQVP